MHSKSAVLFLSQFFVLIVCIFTTFAQYSVPKLIAIVNTNSMMDTDLIKGSICMDQKLIS